MDQRLKLEQELRIDKENLGILRSQVRDLEAKVARLEWIRLGREGQLAVIHGHHNKAHLVST